MYASSDSNRASNRHHDHLRSWGFNKLNNTKLDENSTFEYGLWSKKPHLIKEWAFGRSYFRDVCSGGNNKSYKNSRKELDELENVDQNYYCSNFYDVDVNKYKVICGTSLRFWENKGYTNPIDPYGCFSGILHIS